MVLERSDEHDRPFVGGDVLREVVAVFEVGWQSQVHDADQLVDRSGGPRPAEDHAVAVVATDSVADDVASIFTQPCRLQSRAR